ncbi:MAG: uracil-DNA glycosylase [Candidatus Odinarchaeia archaeon]
MKSKLLNIINEEIKKCKLCLLHLNRNNPVPGEGPESAEIMIIGQAPGREEDLAGKPFVGRSGRLLTQCLHESGIKRENVFITSVLKCFPPNNRPPKISEIKSCLPFLKRQIEIIKPKIIILLGKIAVKAVLEVNDSLKNIRGKRIIKDNITYYVTFHPAAVLRNNNLKDAFIEDLRKSISGLKN